MAVFFQFLVNANLYMQYYRLCMCVCVCVCVYVYVCMCVCVYIYIYGAHGGLVVKALCYKPAFVGSIPDGVIGIFQ